MAVFLIIGRIGPWVKPEGTTNAQVGDKKISVDYYTLEDIEKVVKATGVKPTLVSTGVKAYIPKGMYLEVVLRSSCPLKYWLIMANSVGIIDGDYVDNPKNEGEIFLQLINLSPVPIMLKKGDIIGQGIFKEFGRTDDDITVNKRIGGFGSTNA